MQVETNRRPACPLEVAQYCDCARPLHRRGPRRSLTAGVEAKTRHVPAIRKAQALLKQNPREVESAFAKPCPAFGP